MATENKTHITAYVKNHTEILVGHPTRKEAFYSTIVTIKFRKKPELQIISGLQEIINNYAQKNNTFSLEIEDGALIPLGDKYTSVKCVEKNYRLISEGDYVLIKFKEKSDAESSAIGSICQLLTGQKTTQKST